MEEKTIKEWLEELPDGYRERALTNYAASGPKEESLIDALYNAFVFGESKEGREFWFKVRDHILYNTPLPPLPTEK
jgi:hypothetical protein